MLEAIIIMCSMSEPMTCYPQMAYPTTCSGEISPIENPVEIDNIIYVPTEMVWCDPHSLTWAAFKHDLEPSNYNSAMDKLEKQALDMVFREHMKNLFEVWMREPDPDPTRSIAGADKLRDVYDKVATEIDRRIAEREAKP